MKKILERLAYALGVFVAMITWPLVPIVLTLIALGVGAVILL